MYGSKRRTLLRPLAPRRPAQCWSSATAWPAGGASATPGPRGQKAPVRKAWPRFQVPADTLADYFNGAEQNVGVLLGGPSGGLVCVDLDVREALQLAPTLLPGTGLQHG